MQQIELRHTPVLVFALDENLKKTLVTLQLISQAMDEIQQKTTAAAPGEDQSPDDNTSTDDPGCTDHEESL